MLVLRDPDVGGAVEESFDADPGLGPRERRAGAGVDTAAECDVTTGIWAGDVEFVGLLELAWMAVGGAVITITVVPAGMSTPPTVVGRRDSRKSPLTGLSIRSVSSMMFGMR